LTTHLTTHLTHLTERRTGMDHPNGFPLKFVGHVGGVDDFEPLRVLDGGPQRFEKHDFDGRVQHAQIARRSRQIRWTFFQIIRVLDGKVAHRPVAEERRRRGRRGKKKGRRREKRKEKKRTKESKREQKRTKENKREQKRTELECQSTEQCKQPWTTVVCSHRCAWADIST
jgi:hypothetical protein